MRWITWRATAGLSLPSPSAAFTLPPAPDAARAAHVTATKQGLTLAHFRAQLEDLREHTAHCRAQPEHLRDASTGEFGFYGEQSELKLCGNGQSKLKLSANGN